MNKSIQRSLGYIILLSLTLDFLKRAMWVIIILALIFVAGFIALKTDIPKIWSDVADLRNPHVRSEMVGNAEVITFYKNYIRSGRVLVSDGTIYGPDFKIANVSYHIIGNVGFDQTGNLLYINTYSEFVMREKNGDTTIILSDANWLIYDDKELVMGVSYGKNNNYFWLDELDPDSFWHNIL